MGGSDDWEPHPPETSSGYLVHDINRQLYCLLNGYHFTPNKIKAEIVFPI